MPTKLPKPLPVSLEVGWFYRAPVARVRLTWQQPLPTSVSGRVSQPFLSLLPTSWTACARLIDPLVRCPMTSSLIRCVMPHCSS